MNCPYCAEVIEPTDVKCRTCGEALGKSRVSTLSGSDPIDPTQVIGWAFKDPSYLQKALVGTACFFGAIFILPLGALFGYKLRCARQQLEQPGAEPMPEWSGFMDMAADGLKLLASIFILVFTYLIVIGVVVGALVGLDFATKGKPGPFMIIGFLVFELSAIAFSLLLQVVLMPAIEMEYLETGSIGSAVHFRSLWRRMTTRLGDYLIMAVVNYVIALIAQMVGMIMCFVGVYVTMPLAIYTQGALIGRYLAQQRIKDAALKT
jgi:hypothetical protein